ncbi:MAG: hypothetical protein Q9222_000421 [Ikaeria aurantiellina]
MPSLSPSTGLTITNPLVLYRALLATKRIEPDPAQHRLALLLQKLYHRLKDYEPSIDYKYTLDKLGGPERPHTSPVPNKDGDPPGYQGRRTSVFSSFREQKEKAQTLALTKKLTSHESAMQLQSPQGLLLYGEVGTGKSMLVDLLADCLPNRKKRRWHFSTFMLETFAKLEQLRKGRLNTAAAGQENEHSLLWLARDLISTSPILFLDEFQLPDRAASKILSNLLTSFFHLGGVLVATSNRMPEELANASGFDFAAPPASRLGIFRNRWSLLSASSSQSGRSESMFGGKGDFAAFLEVLRTRCEIWNMEGSTDWRRQTLADADSKPGEEDSEHFSEQTFHGLEPMKAGNWGLGYEQSVSTSPRGENKAHKSIDSPPKYYFVSPADFHANGEDHLWGKAVQQATSDTTAGSTGTNPITWLNLTLRVYGRNLHVPRQVCGVTYWTFNELCANNLGPADYITLASNFHTFILTDIPVLTLLQKNEARRFITLLDALYEARCRLLIRGAAGPDDIFFPNSQLRSPSSTRLRDRSTDISEADDGVYPETFSEIYQDQISPFRPNTSVYTSSASPPSYDSSPLPSSSPFTTPQMPKSARSILADEDSDFGPTYGAGRSAVARSRYRGPSDGEPGAGNEIGLPSPDFSQTSSFTGEDEKFAYKRAQSRLWELCGARWWAKGHEWWRPLSKEGRRWEHSADEGAAAPALGQSDASTGTAATTEGDTKEILFRHSASPFRTSQDPPPKISWTHAWGMMKWGKKAGAWGQGPEGLSERGKPETNGKE